MSVLQLTEQGIDNDPGGVVNRQQQRELRSVFPKPSVVAAVYLDQHTLTRHTLTPNSVLWWTPTARAVLIGAHQQATQRAASYVYAFAFPQQLAHMRVVGPRIPRARQMQHSGLRCLRYRVGRSTTSMTVGECGCSILPVCRQYAPGMACAHSHQRRCLLYRHMLRQQTVEYLKPCLFSLSLSQKSPRPCLRQNGATTGVTIPESTAIYDYQGRC